MLARRRTGLLLAVTAFVLSQGAYRSGWLDNLDHQLLAVCYKVRGPAPADPAVVIVAADDGRRETAAVWPPPPEFWPSLLETLRAGAAGVIALDVLALTAAGGGEWSGEQATALAESVRGCGNVVLPTVLDRLVAGRRGPPAAFSAQSLPDAGKPVVPIGLRGSGVLWPEAVGGGAAGFGHINVYPDADGAVRFGPLLSPAGGRLWPSLALEAVRVYRGLPPGSARLGRGFVGLGKSRYEVSGSGEVPLNYPGGPGHFPCVAASELLSLSPDKLREALGGRVVIVGPTAVGAGSFWATPVHPMMPGVEIQATVISNLLRGDWLRVPAPWVPFCGVLVAVLVLGWALPELRPARCVIVSVLCFAAALMVVMVCFARGVWLPAGMVLLGVGLAGGALSTQAGVIAENERAHAETRLNSRLQAMDGIGDIIASSTDRDQLLSEIVRWVERELSVPAVSILLLDERRRRLTFEVASGEKGEAVKSFALELGQGVAGQVALSGEPLIVQEARSDPRQARDIAEAVEYPAESLLCVPMRLHGEVIGVIEAMNKTTGPFTAYDQSLLSVIAHQAALFLESSRVYSELQQAVEAATMDLVTVNRDLAAQKSKLETLVAEMDAGVIATDSQDRLVTLNPAAVRMLGLQGKQLVGEPILAVVTHPGLSSLLTEPLTPRGGRLSEEIEVGRPGERDHLILRAFVTMLDETGGRSGRLCLLTDITRLKELDRMKTDVVSFVSHELQSPLSSILAFAQTIQRGVEAGSAVATTSRYLSHAAGRMLWLVKDFLDVTRLQSGVELEMHYETIQQPGAWLEGLVELQEVSAGDHRFVVDVPADLAPFVADRGKLEQVLANLLNNAVKYSPDGGEVRLSARAEDDHLRLEVSDEGVGISPDEIPNLFQQFRRTGEARERVRGTGIGLYLSRHLVEAHGGRIWATPRHKGTTFGFTIPLRPAQEVFAATHGPTDPPETGRPS